VYGEFDIGVIT